jgi:O-antigen/teichoic acid export membrane protein
MMAYAGILQWLTFSLGRFLPEHRDREEVILSHVAAAYAGVALLVLVVALAAVAWPAGERGTLAIGAAILVTLSLAELNLVLFQMRGEAGLYARFALLRVIVAAAIGIALAVLGWGSGGLLLGVVAGHLCIVLPNLRRHWGPVRLRLLRTALLRDLAAYGFPFAMTGALAAVIQASDRYVIGALMGADDVGLYAAPYDLAMRSLHVLMMVVAMASQPLVFHTFEAEGGAAAEPLIRRQAELLMGVGLPAAIGCALLGPAIAHLLLGPAFQAAAHELMPWIACATVLSGFQSFYLALAFSLPKKPLRQTYIFAVGAAVNLGLNVVLIPSFGLIGAALATIVAYALIAVGSFLVGRRLHPLPFPALGLVKIALACAVWALILWPVRKSTDLGPVLLHGVLGGAAYLALFCGLDVANTRQLGARALQQGFSPRQR